MLMLAFDASIGPGPQPLPEFLGGVLHGYFEAAVANHAQQLSLALRPGGPNDPASFMIVSPPFGHPVDTHLRFGVVLFGNLCEIWTDVLIALLNHSRHKLNSRSLDFVRVHLRQPDGSVQPLMDDGRLAPIKVMLVPPEDYVPRVSPATTPSHTSLCQLGFASPLLLASRKAQRERYERVGRLPWPSLNGILASIFQRMRSLDPRWPALLDFPEDWTEPAEGALTEPLTPARDPARQVVWHYTSVPRTHAAVDNSSRTIPVPGIVGQLAYIVPDDRVTRALLHWGQWFGVGQKTTMGCGSYVLKCT